MESAIASAYSKSWLNTTLSRWLHADLTPPVMDCAGCARPTKCCAFQPFVPNFLLGGWLYLRSELPQIKNVAFHPIGAVALPEYRQKHQAIAEDQHGVEFLCGFFDRETRACNLWDFRPGECSTYFCDADRIRPDRQDLSRQSFGIESAVAQMALVELGMTPSQIGAQVDILNGEAGVQNYPGAGLLMMYKNAWNWSQTLKAQTIQSWLAPESP